ncbi:MAG TPA: hypothetical protein VJ974_05255 [Geopsychrobacteraceae bacterium]|nr:hypothetical protein [Geopsychrobacteraceae bacterium]
MKTILIAGNRPEIGKLFELLLWQPNLKFVSAKKFSQCLDLSLRTNPNLIIVEGNPDHLTEAHQTIVSLKGSSQTSDIPVFITRHENTAKELLEGMKPLIEGVIPEPFNPKEIKNLAEKYI